MPGGNESTWPQTRQMAVSAVESVPNYIEHKSKLVQWCVGGLDEEDLPEVDEFMAKLATILQSNPIYPSQSDESQEPRLKVEWLTDEQAAKKLRLTRAQLRLILNAPGTTLPFGTFRYKRTWHIHPLDIEQLAANNR